jgi:hypothetical protein
MVFEILGVNLLEIMKRYDYKGIPLPIVRRMTKQVLIGLDYLHRKCKIIHTDLKPENVIVALTNEELREIASRGSISTMNKNIKTRDVVGDTVAPEAAQNETLLSNIDTTGMSKQQKKKLKKKLKKILQTDVDGEEKEEADTPPKQSEAARGAITSREIVKEQSPDNVASEKGSTESSIERPRNHSLPNMTWTEDPKASALDETDSIESLRDTDSPTNKPDGSWEYVLTRDFRGEVENYITLKQKKEDKKMKPKAEKIP